MSVDYQVGKLYDDVINYVITSGGLNLEKWQGRGCRFEWC